MLIESLDVPTTEETENSLVVTIQCKQLIIAYTSIVNSTSSAHSDPGATGPTVEGSPRQLQPL